MMFANPNKLVLCATANQLLVGVWHAGKLQGNQIFENNETGHEAFSAFLAQYILSPVYLIADAVEEDFRLESLPHTSGSAKHELVTRKLNQHYRGLDYRTAHFIDRDKDKRKDDNFLFAAISKDDFLQAWVAILKAQEAQLVGVYLLPMLSLVLMKQLKLSAPHLLLCEKLSSGLRQTYFHHGRLRMSRLVPNVPEAPGQIGYFYLVEIEKTRLYLMSQRHISRETPLNLALVSVDGSTQQISQGISQEQGLTCSDVSLSSLAKTLDLPVKLLHEKPELMHMQLLANGHFVDNLAPDWLTKPFQFSKLKQGLAIGSALIGFFGLVAAGWMLKEGLDHKSAFEQAQQDTLIQQHRYDEAAKDFPVTEISANDLKVAVELDKTVTSFPKSPRRMMQVISAALAPAAKAPLDEVQIDRLHWVLTNDTHVNDQDKFTPLPITSGREQSAINTSPVDPNMLMEVAFLTAQISGFTGDYRRALNTLSQFVNNIKADARVAEVVVLQEPVNVSSFVSLQGSTTDEQSTQKQPAFFKLKVVLKPNTDLVANMDEAKP
ncbi:MAG: hypothetical protein Q7U33_11865 [Methylotenera sp.]|uniref:hypothetical protein n=1 Tax=Methylotenera sp. TaxID=2051956 RepID=UPI002715F1BE|nr:hypothetical protein [Methylotenera sp.]MDO9152065.1 hypothetical protein [Methylotenera sp.]